MAASETFDVVLGSGRLRVQRWGAPGAPLVIGVPGLSGTSANVAYLGSRLGGADLQVVGVDLRGRGWSDQTGPGTYGWERHARDVLALAGELGHDRFAVVGQSMGGSVAMKAAELDGDRLAAVVLVDVAGRVDPGIGPVIGSWLARLGQVHASVEDHLAEIRASGLIVPWDRSWDAVYGYDLEDVDGGVRARTSPEAVAEDRAYTATQDPHERWAHLTMPTLLARATQELAPGAGHVVPAGERDAFRRAVPHAEVVEIDANHTTINAHPDLAAAVDDFLRRTLS